MDTPIINQSTVQDKPDADELTHIYALVRKSDKYPFYIGKSNNVTKRLTQHRANAKDSTRKSKVYAYIRKLWRIGDDFDISIVQSVSKSQWGQAEVKAMASYRAAGIPLKNVAPGGVSPEMTDEIRKKLSVALTGRKFSDEHKRKLSDAKKGVVPWNKGKTSVRPRLMASDETREKISQALKGREFTKEWKQKISDATMGRIPANKGKHGLQGRKILQIDPKTNEVLNVFENGFFALQHLGKNSSSRLSEAATGKSETAYGYKWAYSLDEHGEAA
jgi:group I intron endonuclease